MPAGIAKSEVTPRIVEDVDSNEPAPPDVSPYAPLPENRRGTHIISFKPSQCSTPLSAGPAGAVADI